MQLVMAQPVGEGQLVSIRQRHLEVFLLEGDSDLQGEDEYQKRLGRVLTGAWWCSPGRCLRAIAGLSLDLTLTSDPGLKHM